MQVYQHVQAVGSAPRPAVFQMAEAFLADSALFVLQHVVIDRHPHMVKPEPGDKSDVFRGDEAVKMLLVKCSELGDPSSQIDSFLKTGK